MNLKTLEKIQSVWDWFTSKINYWIDSQYIASYFLSAYDAEKRINELLKTKDVKYVILIEDDTEYYRWLKVRIEVFIDLPFNKGLAMYDEIIDVTYQGMSKLSSKGVYVSVEPMSMLRVSPKEG